MLGAGDRNRDASREGWRRRPRFRGEQRICRAAGAGNLCKFLKSLYVLNGFPAACLCYVRSQCIARTEYMNMSTGTGHANGSENETRN